MTRSRDIADQQDNAGGAVAPYVAGKNALINGGFDIWQRGTTAVTGSGYFADRWRIDFPSNISVSQQTSGAPVGSRYYLRGTSTGAGSYFNCYQYIETANCSALWGKTVTVSIKMRRNATLNNSGIQFILDKSSTVDAGSGATWGTIGSATATLADLPTGTTSDDWFTAFFTVAIPNDGTANSLRVFTQYSGATASGSVVDIAQAQLEVGNVMTPFARAGGSIGGELALCQRYYYRVANGDVYSPYGMGYASSTTQGIFLINHPVPMRVRPISIDYNSIYAEQFNGVSSTAGVATISNSSPFLTRINITGLSGLTTGSIMFAYSNNNTAGYLGFSAEL